MEDHRREVRHLEIQDQVQSSHKMTWEVIDVGEPENDGTVTVQVKPVLCGPHCGESCDCSSATFGDCGPFKLRINGRKRLTFLGNLGRLMKDAEALQARIARLKGNGSELTGGQTKNGVERNGEASE